MTGTTPTCTNPTTDSLKAARNARGSFIVFGMLAAALAIYSPFQYAKISDDLDAARALRHDKTALGAHVKEVIRKKRDDCAMVTISRMSDAEKKTTTLADVYNQVNEECAQSMAQGSFYAVADRQIDFLDKSKTNLAVSGAVALPFVFLFGFMARESHKRIKELEGPKGP